MSRRRSLPDALQSAQLKLKRANLHTKTAKREASRFLNRYPKPTFRIAQEGEIAVGQTFDIWNVVDKGYPDPPESFSTRLGDAIHNYRCVLDHIAWQLVKHGSCPDPTDPHLVQFPIYSSEGAFNSNRERRLPGVADGPVDFIKARQSTPTWNFTNNPLLILADFSNDDKHRAIKVVVAGIASGEVYTAKEVNCTPVMALVSQRRPVLKHGTPVAGYRLLCTGPDPKVRMYGRFTASITIEDTGELMFFLECIKQEVTEILHAPEIAAGLG